MQFLYSKSLKNSRIVHFILCIGILLTSNLILAHTSADVIALLDSSKLYSGSNNNLSIQYSKEALLQAKKLNIDSLITKSYLLLGQSNYINGDQDEALKCYLTGQQLAEKSNDMNRSCQILNELGILYLKQQKFQEAKSSLKKSAKYAEKLNNLALLANAYNNLGLIFNDTKQLDSAEYYFNIAYSKYKQIQNNLGMSYALDYLSSVYVNTNRLGLAESKLKESLVIKEVLKDKVGEAIVINNIGELYQQQKDYQKALYQYKAAGDSAQKIKFLDLEAYTYQMRSDIYFELNDFKNAYHYAKLYKEKNELLLNEKKIKAIEIV